MDDQIRALLDSGELTFKGARKRYNLAPGVYGILSRVGIEHANATGEPRAAASPRPALRIGSCTTKGENDNV